MMDLEAILDIFEEMMDTPAKLRDFLVFYANHPELSYDNAAILYVQNPNEKGRYIIHKGLAEHYGIDRNGPYTLYQITMNNQYVFSRAPGVFYAVPEDKGASMTPEMPTLPDLFSAMKMTIIRGGRTPALRLEERKISIPESMSEEAANAYLLRLYVQIFYSFMQERIQIIPISKTEFKNVYAEILEFMLAQLLHVPGIMLSGHAFTAVTGGETDPYARRDAVYHVMERVFYYWTELDQAVEGRHFTFYETQIYRMTGNRLFDERYDVALNPEGGMDSSGFRNRFQRFFIKIHRFTGKSVPTA